MKNKHWWHKTQIKSSTIKWHIQRDNCVQLAKFCDEWQIDRKVSDYYTIDGIKDKEYYLMTTFFGNGGWIEAELERNTSVNEHYQVVDYRLCGKIKS